MTRGGGRLVILPGGEISSSCEVGRQPINSGGREGLGTTPGPSPAPRNTPLHRRLPTPAPARVREDSQRSSLRTTAESGRQAGSSAPHRTAPRNLQQRIPPRLQGTWRLPSRSHLPSPALAKTSGARVGAETRGSRDGKMGGGGPARRSPLLRPSAQIWPSLPSLFCWDGGNGAPPPPFPLTGASRRERRELSRIGSRVSPFEHSRA